MPVLVFIAVSRNRIDYRMCPIFVHCTMIFLRGKTYFILNGFVILILEMSFSKLK